MTNQERIAELEAILRQIIAVFPAWEISLAMARAHQYFEAVKHESEGDNGG